MGSKCSKNSNKDNKDEILSDYDRTIFDLKREKVFYGTIAICILYASFALLLFILSLLSDKIKFLLLNNFLPFTIVYIIGTVIIVLYLIAQVMEFKPYKIDKSIKYNDMSCPDYWVLEPIKRQSTNETDIAETNKYFDYAFDSNSINKNNFNYRCALNSNIFNKYDIYKANIKTINNNLTYKYFYTDLTTGYDNIADEDEYKNTIKNATDKNQYSIYANIADRTTLNDLKKKLFNDDTNVMVDFLRQALLMNNYKIIKNDKINYPEDNLQYEYYERSYNIIANPSTEYDKLKQNLPSVRLHNFNYAPSSSGTAIDDKKIRLDKTNGDLHVNIATSGTPNFTLITHFPLTCDKMYPLIMASKDNDLHNTNDKFDNNVFRCAYSKLCGIPWSDMNCDVYKDINNS